MMPSMNFATRPSKLARWQTQHIIQSLETAWPSISCEETVIITKGDKTLDRPLPEIGGKGLFTLELEEALLDKRVDAAVHSLKDLPTDNPDGLTIGLIPPREDVRDVLIAGDGITLDDLPDGATVGTSSLRRQAQLLAYRPDLKTQSIRGNIDTRIRKFQEGQYDAIILAAAGLHRLGLNQHISQYIPLEIMLPAPGQGALAVQCRADDTQTLKYLNALQDEQTQQAVTAERTLLDALGGGCSLPVGAFAYKSDGCYQMEVIIANINGEQILQFNGKHENPVELGKKLAKEAISQGANEVLHV